MKIKINIESLYKIFLFLLIAMYMLESSSIPNFSNSFFHDIIQCIALIAITAYIFCRRFTSAELIRIFSIILIGILCYISSGFSGLLMTMLAITLMPNNSLDNILNMIFKEELFLFFIIISLALLGILDIGSLKVSKGMYVVDGISLGFSHPNMLAAQGMSIVFLYLCINRYKLRLKHYLISIVSAIVLFNLSKGRIPFFLGICAIIVIWISNNNYYLKKKIVKILPYTYTFVLFIIFIFLGLYSRNYGMTTIAKFINDNLFNGRIGLAYTSLMIYPVTLFGKPIDLSIWNQYQYFALDNGQVMVLLEFGIIGFIAYFYIIQKTLCEIKKEKEVVFGIILSFFLIWSMYEGTMYFIGKNFALLFLGTKKIGFIKNIKKRGGKV